MELPYVLKLVVGRKQGHGSSKILLFHKIFLCQLNFMEIIRLSQSCGKSGHPKFWGILPDF